MATIQKVENKKGISYRIFISNGYDTNGKQIRETTTFIPDTTKTAKKQEKELEKFVFDFEQSVLDGKYLSGEKVTFKEFTVKWLQEYGAQQLERTTLENYKTNLNNKIIPAIGHLKIAKIKPMQLQSFYNELSKDGARTDGKKGSYSSGTIKKLHVVISSIMSTAVKWQVIESNPCERVSVPKQQKNYEDIKHFTLEQAEIFLNALNKTYIFIYKGHHRNDDTGKIYYVSEYQEKRIIPTQFKVLFNMALFGGLRRGELIALQWDDIDFVNNTVSITKSTGYVNGEAITKVPKTKSSIRTISIPNSVMKLLKQYKIEQDEIIIKLGSKWKGEREKRNKNYLFIQWDGKQMNSSTPYHTFKDIIKKYNETVNNELLKLPNIPLHGLRHTSATLLISLNVDIKTVSNRLGHAQTSTTMNIYAHSLKKMDETASDALENLLHKQAQ